jgi:integrase
MPKAKITNRFTALSSCQSSKSKEVYYDTELSGFILDVSKTGLKTFYYSYSLDNKRTMHKLGNADTMTADEARHLALKMRKAIATDSLETMFTKKNKIITLKQFYDEHYLPHVKVNSNSWKKNESVYRMHILPELGHYTMNTINFPMIVKLHKEMVVKKKLKNGSANKVIVFLRHAYNLAMELKIDGIVDNPAKKVKLFEEQHRDRYLTQVEARRLITAVETSTNNSLKYIVPFLLLSGARKSEVLRAEWSDINLELGIWTIPITKNKKIRKVPLSPELRELIIKIPTTSLWLFPSPKIVGHYTCIKHSWNMARTQADLEDVRIHDLRHSYASTLVNNGRSLYEVQRLLGHSDVSMTQRYAHLSNESLLAAASCAGRLLK